MKPEASALLSLTSGREECLPNGLDWVRFERLAVLHQMDAYCGYLLRKDRNRKSPDDSVFLTMPEPLQSRFYGTYLYHLMRSEALLVELPTLHQALQDRQVVPIYLKGLWLARSAWPDPGARPMGDIDICVGEEAFEAATDALLSLGYETGSSRFPRSGAEALNRAHYSGQLRFQCPGRRPIELHFRLVNLGHPRQPEEWLRYTARSIPAGNVPLPVPGPEAMLLHLLLHANQHGFCMLRLLHDIRWCLAKDRQVIDLDRLVLLIEAFRCRTAAYFSLRLARDLAGAQVDPALLSTLRPSRFRREAFSLVWRLGAVRKLEARRLPQACEAPYFYLMEMGRAAERISYGSRVLQEAGAFRALRKP